MKKLLLLLVSILLAVGLSSCASVPMPEVTQGEFPFEIVYEKNGESITVSDVYVCELEGVEWNENVGKHRQWKGYVKSTGEGSVVLHTDGDVRITCNVGTAAYYMSDPLGPDIDEITPTVQRVQTFASGGVSAMALDADALLEQYGIRLVSWEFSSPIENTYK